MEEIYTFLIPRQKECQAEEMSDLQYNQYNITIIN